MQFELVLNYQLSIRYQKQVVLHTCEVVDEDELALQGIDRWWQRLLSKTNESLSIINKTNTKRV